MILNFFNISGGEIFIILIVVFLVFGPDKIPEIARWLGKGVGEIKKATSEIRDEITRETGDIKREADQIRQDLKIENPLKSSPSSGFNKAKTTEVKKPEQESKPGSENQPEQQKNAGHPANPETGQNKKTEYKKKDDTSPDKRKRDPHL